MADQNDSSAARDVLKGYGSWTGSGLSGLGDNSVSPTDSHGENETKTTTMNNNRNISDSDTRTQIETAGDARVFDRTLRIEIMGEAEVRTKSPVKLTEDSDTHIPLSIWIDDDEYDKASAQAQATLTPAKARELVMTPLLNFIVLLVLILIMSSDSL